MSQQLRTDLEKAAALIEEKGHVQGQLKGIDGKICMLQSIAEATEGSDERERVARNYVTEKLNTNICDWNNADGRTGEEVAAKLRELAAEVPVAAAS